MTVKNGQALYLKLGVSLLADPGVLSSNPVWPHTFVETHHGKFSKGLLLYLMIHEGLLSVAKESMWTEYSLTA